MLWRLHQNSWFRWWCQRNQLWNHCNVQAKGNASKVTRQRFKSRMLVSTHRGMCLDTSSVCCWRPWIEKFIHNSRQSTQQSTLQQQATSCLKRNGVGHSIHSQFAWPAQVISLAGMTHKLEWEAPNVVLSHMPYKLGLLWKNKMTVSTGLGRSMLHLEQVLWASWWV